MADISKINAVLIANIAEIDDVLAANIAKVNGLVFSTAFVGLLDTYTGATAAYSTRRLYSLYTGAALRVREDSGDTETDIGFDSNGDLDTAAIATHCGTANGYVTKWYDQSTAGGTGSGNDANQSTAALQPQIYNGTSVLTENGKPVVKSTHATGVGFNVSLGLTQPFTYAGTGALLTAGWSFGFNPQIYGTNNLYRLYAGVFFDQTFALNNRQHIMVAKYNGASTQAQALTSSGSTSGTGNAGGASAFNYILHRRNTDQALQGANMQEMIFWDTGQSASNMDGIETDMDTYFSVS